MQIRFAVIVAVTADVVAFDTASFLLDSPIGIFAVEIVSRVAVVKAAENWPISGDSWLVDGQL